MRQKNNKMSEKYWTKGKKLVLDGTSLFSRGPRITVDGVAPKYISKANGSRFTTVDKEEYLDYGMAVGSVLLGHGYIDDDVFANIRGRGVNLSLLSPYQVELAERLHHNIPSCGKLKFLSSGSEATEAAVRIARIYTNRDKIIRDHYHGWIIHNIMLFGRQRVFFAVYFGQDHFMGEKVNYLLISQHDRVELGTPFSGG